SKISGKESVQVAAELDYLGQVRLRQGRYVEAAALINHSISIRTKVLGLNCIECVWSMEELSTVLERQGKLEEAEKLMRKALSI
ncbi:tetratricopeptide repeat protein, partial [Salmonella enterica]|uniref:tetratricopeptide repeat protein n=1 Tax=Salmonella enterica TaxID=28901 RepID=UPI003D2D44AA